MDEVQPVQLMVAVQISQDLVQSSPKIKDLINLSSILLSVSPNSHSPLENISHFHRHIDPVPVAYSNSSIGATRQTRDVERRQLTWSVAC